MSARFTALDSYERDSAMVLRRLSGILLALLLLISPAMLPASSARPEIVVPDRPLTPGERATTLLQIAEQLRDGYIYEAKGEALATRLEVAAKDDRFAVADRLPDFVAQLNEYLFELSDDRHLRVIYDDSLEPRTRRGVVHGGGGHGPAGRQVDVAYRGNDPADFGFAAVEMLEGNIGYVDLRGFSDEPASKAAADSAMTAIAGAAALVIDVGRNGGGGPFMVRYLSGFLFAEPTHLASTDMRGMDGPLERWTLHDGRPTDAFVDVPVYILTSRRTFSAAESFTFGLETTGRVTIVGERTGGGGHFGGLVALDGGLRVFIPRGRTYDPRTGKGWEAEGIQPDIEVPYDEALEVALQDARSATGGS